MTTTEYDGIQHKFFGDPAAYQTVELQRKIAEARYRQTKELARLVRLAGARVAGFVRAWLLAHPGRAQGRARPPQKALQCLVTAIGVVQGRSNPRRRVHATIDGHKVESGKKLRAGAGPGKGQWRARTPGSRRPGICARCNAALQHFDLNGGRKALCIERDPQDITYRSLFRGQRGVPVLLR